MQLNFPVRLALRYFSAKKSEKLVSFISGFSMLGVMIGVASLVVVMAVMNGFHLELTKNILGLNSDIAIIPHDSTFSEDQQRDIISKIRSEPFVKRIFPVANGQALAIGKRASSGVAVQGITVDSLKEKTQISKNIVSGSIGDFQNNSLILGSELAVILGMKVGDYIRLVSPNTLASAFGYIPRIKDFKISAVFKSGLYDYDSAVVIMPIEQASKFLSLEGNSNNLEVYSTNPDLSVEFAEKISSILGSNNFIVNNWQNSHEQFLNALRVERVVMFIILSLIVIVACFNIVSSLFMLVKDKTHDIAILRTMGASKTDIMLIFILNGLIIGVIGTGLGLIIGVSFAANINTIKAFLESVTQVRLFDSAVYLLYNLPAKIVYYDVFKICLLSLTTSLLSTLYPAYRAASMQPIEALRNE